MKHLFSKTMLLGLLVVGLVAAAVATPTLPAVSGPTYPTTNPQYTPLAVLGPITVSAPTNILFTNSGSDTVAYTAQGACTGLTMTASVSNDGTNFVTTNMYPINSTATTSAVTTTSASGVWRSNTAAIRYFQLNITALTGSCTIGVVGDEHPLTLY